MSSGTTKRKATRPMTEAEREAEVWRRIEARQERDRQERLAARATWTPEAIAEAEARLQALIESWRAKRERENA